MIVGYARVSTQEQNTNLQEDALRGVGCEKIAMEVASGVKRRKRPVLDAIVASLREGDVLVVWKLDRLGRSITQLATLFEALQRRGIGFRSLSEQIDSTLPMGRAMLSLCGVFAELEHSLIAERTTAGLAAAKKRGAVGGRPRKVDTAKVAEIRARYSDNTQTIAQICRHFGISRATLYRYLNDATVPINGFPA